MTTAPGSLGLPVRANASAAGPAKPGAPRLCPRAPACLPWAGAGLVPSGAGGREGPPGSWGAHTRCQPEGTGTSGKALCSAHGEAGGRQRNFSPLCCPKHADTGDAVCKADPSQMTKTSRKVFFPLKTSCTYSACGPQCLYLHMGVKN